MNIEHNNTDTKGSFKAWNLNNLAGEMTYVWAGKTQFIIDHTEVNLEFKGKGIGKQLVAAAVAFAKENNLKIIPLCPFAKRVFDTVPDYKIVL